MASKSKSQKNVYPDRDAAQIYARLSSIGLPSQVTLEEFARLYQGSMADALLFISEHMLGRQRVNKARRIILKAKEDRARTRVRHPDDVLRGADEKAKVGFENACRAVEVAKKDMKVAMEGIRGAEQEVERLEMELKEKEKVLLLLQVLERRERLRIERFQEMGRMLGELREKVLASPTQRKAFQQPNDQLLPLLPSQPRFHHTRDTLTNLHAYHIRLSRVAQEKRPEGQTHESLTIQLKKALALRGIDDPEILDRCISLARQRTREKMKYHSRLSDQQIHTSEDLDNKNAVLCSRQKKLQEVLDQIIALEYASQHHLRSISVFVEETSHVLRASLEQDVPLTKGYIDLLRGKAMRTSLRTDWNGNQGFIQQIQDVLGLRGNAPSNVIVETVRSSIVEPHEQESFLAKNIIPSPSSSTEKEALIETYRTNLQAAQERVVKLLTRKVDKAEKGFSLAADIENLLREMKIIAGKEN